MVRTLFFQWGCSSLLAIVCRLEMTRNGRWKCVKTRPPRLLVRVAYDLRCVDSNHALTECDADAVWANPTARRGSSFLDDFRSGKATFDFLCREAVGEIGQWRNDAISGDAPGGWSAHNNVLQSKIFGVCWRNIFSNSYWYKWCNMLCIMMTGL